MYQKLIFIGNLGSNPEMRFTPNGDPVTSFSVATSRKYGEKDETTWFSGAGCKDYQSKQSETQEQK